MNLDQITLVVTNLNKKLRDIFALIILKLIHLLQFFIVDNIAIIVNFTLLFEDLLIVEVYAETLNCSQNYFLYFFTKC